MRYLLDDVRSAFRAIRKNSSHSLLVILILAMGVGAVCSIFSVADAALFRQLPYRDPDRLYCLWNKLTSTHDYMVMSTTGLFEVDGANFSAWRERSRSFESIAAFADEPVTVSGLGDPVRLLATKASADFFSTLGVSPLFGRDFSRSGEIPGQARAVVLSYDLWQSRFRGSPDVIGQSFRVNGKPATVVGVMRPGFRFRVMAMPRWSPDLWIALDRTDADWLQWQLNAVGRLRPGVSSAQAQAEIAAISRQVFETAKGSMPGVDARVIPLRNQLAGEVRPGLLILLGAVGCLLLIACANAANLMLTRAAQRRGETAVRFALGAARKRIIQAAVVESIVMGVIAGAAGLALAMWSEDFVVALLPTDVPRIFSPHIDTRVFVVAAVVAFATGVVVGVIPAVRASKEDVSDALKQNSRTSAGYARLRKSLVVFELAASLTLTIAAGLMLRSFMRLEDVNIGFNPRQVITVGIPYSGEGDAARQKRGYEQLLQRLTDSSELSGNHSLVALADTLPLQGSMTTSFRVEGHNPPKPWGEEEMIAQLSVSPGYFRSLQIPLTSGRDFNATDNQTSPPVVIISRALAHHFWPNQSPIGRHLQLGDSPWLEIIGVSGDVRSNLTDQPLETAYTLYLQQPKVSGMEVVAHTSEPPDAFARDVRAILHQVLPDQPLGRVTTMEGVFSESTTDERFRMVLYGFFGIAALLIAGTGVYSVLSYMVTQRMRELGIRVALGADRANVLSLVVSQGMALAIAGVLCGCVVSLAFTRVLRSQLFGVSAADPMTFTAVALLLLALTALASYFPAVRATRVDPANVLRAE